ncbi:MAG: hypothetical protein AAF125_20625, partial [Chloroflexota bacterium]
MPFPSAFRAAIWSAWVALLTVGVIVLNAQPAACPTLVEAALERFDGFCTTLDRNTACYGNNAISATFVEGVPAGPFSAPGDLAPLTTLARLDASPLDVERDLWGLAALKLQTVLPGTLPGQGIVFVMAGDAQVEADASEATTNAFESFYFTAGLGTGGCAQAPDTVYVQGPETTEVQIRANGVDINIGSTIALNGDERGVRVATLAGEATITCADGEQIFIPAGFTTRNLNTVVLNEGLDGRENDVVVLDCSWENPSPLSV